MSKYNSHQRRDKAGDSAEFKPGMMVLFFNPRLGEFEAKVEFVDTIHVVANGEYTAEHFMEDALEFNLMVLNDRGFAVQRIRARIHELRKVS